MGGEPVLRLGAVTTCYRDAETIRGTMACLAPFVSRHVVMASTMPFYGDMLPDDGTLAICREYGAHIIEGVWPEHIMRNVGIEACWDCDWVLGFDADEMMTAEDINKLIGVLEKTPYDAIGFISKVYWHSPDYRFDPDPDHVKVCVTRVKGNVRYVDKQCVNGAYDTLDYKYPPYITHHHLSWASPKDILRKVIHYNHANEFDGATWYDKYYKDWKAGDEVVQPFGTKWKAAHDPLPDELRRLL